MKISLNHKFEEIISLENLLLAWQEFLPGKRHRLDVQVFAADLMDNIFSLHYDLLYHKYQSGAYQAFNISDPKPRNIHKATVRDRLLHRAIYRYLFPFFNRIFIADSYSSRLNKGTHKATARFRQFIYQVGHNNTGAAWALKGDIRKFFASINHDILLDILREYIPDDDVLWLLEKVIKSFCSSQRNKGLPLGNLTSQLFVNIYLNKFDQFVKHKIKVRHYIRYADDFVILSENKEWLKEQVEPIKSFLSSELKLELHPNKLFLKSISAGMDWLGWVNFPDHCVLRATTRMRMFRKISAGVGLESFNSYLGLLSHGNTEKLKLKLTKLYFSDHCFCQQKRLK